MEELLNKLIEKGWKPRGLNIMGKIVIDYDIEFAFDIYDSLQKGHWNFRELVSKESGLWQFVCKNELLNIKKEKKRITPEHLRVFNGEYQYRLIESALCDENKIEDFLLSNIKVEG